MPLYTIRMDYRGGTYITQISAPTELKACIKWANDLDLSSHKYIGPKGKRDLIEEMHDKDMKPVLLQECINAWCTCALIRGTCAHINIVQTDIGK